MGLAIAFGIAGVAHKARGIRVASHVDRGAVHSENMVAPICFRVGVESVEVQKDFTEDVGLYFSALLDKGGGGNIKAAVVKLLVETSSLHTDYGSLKGFNG